MGGYLASVVASALRLGLGAQVTSVSSWPQEGQRIYFANHTSHLDFVVIWAALPRLCRNATRPVAAKDFWTERRLRRYVAAGLFRAVLIDRAEASRDSCGALGGRAVLEPLLEALDEGSSLILFPEGTRGSGEQIGPFKSGLYYLAHLRPHVQLVPVYLENLNRILPKGEYLPVPLMSRVVFGPPVELGKGESRNEFLERARLALSALESI